MDTANHSAQRTIELRHHISSKYLFKHTSAPRGAMRPGFCWKMFALKTEGVGNAGCPVHPQPRVVCSKHAR